MQFSLLPPVAKAATGQYIDCLSMLLIDHAYYSIVKVAKRKPSLVQHTLYCKAFNFFKTKVWRFHQVFIFSLRRLNLAKVFACVNVCSILYLYLKYIVLIKGLDHVTDMHQLDTLGMQQLVNTIINTQFSREG